MAQSTTTHLHRVESEEEVPRRWEPNSNDNYSTLTSEDWEENSFHRSAIVSSDDEGEDFYSSHEGRSAMVISDDEEEEGGFYSSQEDCSAIVISDDDDEGFYSSHQDEGYDLASVVQNLTHVMPHVSDDSSPSSGVKASQRVEIIGGKYKGSRGTFVRKTNCRVVVQLEDASEHCLVPHNVRFLDPSSVRSDVSRSFSFEARTSPSASAPLRRSSEARASPTAVTETIFFSGDTVRIVSGLHRGKRRQ
jgi:ribosomal protein L24